MRWRPRPCFLNGMGEDNLAEFGAAREGEGALRTFLDAQRPALVSGDSAAVIEGMRSLLPEADAAAFTDDFATFLLACFQEGLRSGVDGWVDDDLAFLAPWGFDLDAPDRHGIPVSVWQGTADLMVPAAPGWRRTSRGRSPTSSRARDT